MKSEMNCRSKWKNRSSIVELLCIYFNEMNDIGYIKSNLKTLISNIFGHYNYITLIGKKF